MVHDTPALAVEGLRKRHGSGAGAVDALVGIDLAFAPGTFTAIAAGRRADRRGGSG
jgi:putative ABC transport system ATP-binding protein